MFPKLFWVLVLTGILLLSITLSFAQRTGNDTINTGVIDVVKPYTPTISDAFKVKEVPALDDVAAPTKKEIKYNIFSFPVASTFTPAKGKAQGLEKAKKEVYYDNYASLGVGNFTTVLGELYVNHAFNRNESIGGHISHHSSGGGIKDLEFDDNFLDSKINLNYTKQLRELSWNAEGGFQYQNFNWYGVPESQIAAANVANIETNHAFINAHVGGGVSFNDTYINSAEIMFRRFADNQNSGENRLSLKTLVDVPFRDTEIATTLKIDYLGGGFERAYTTNDALEDGNFQVGLSPSYKFEKNDLTLNLGFSAFYLNDLEASENKFFVYPNIKASYNLASDVLIAYGGITGDLIQNSYHGFATKNSFVSPTLFVTPTDQQYNAFLGLKGKLTSTMSYDISGSYVSEKNKALFRNNEIIATDEAYTFGNSFGVIYDNVATFGAAGQINVDVNRNFKLALKAEYFNYDTKGQLEAWNLPELKGSVFLDYQISEKWFTGANLFFVGERKDQFFEANPLISSVPQIVTLDSYFDANAHAGYHINNQLSAFLKLNNIANQGYEQWQNFPVQTFQVLAGATYKFDF